MMLFHNIDIYYFMADGIAIWEILFKYQYYCFRLMLLPFWYNFIGRCYSHWLVADVIPLWLMLLPIVYSFNDMADVIAITVADVIATLFLYCIGWCYCQLCVADVIATEADVIDNNICHTQLAITSANTI